MGLFGKEVIEKLEDIAGSDLFSGQTQIEDNKEGFYLKTNGPARNLMIMWPEGKQGLAYFVVEKRGDVMSINYPNMVNRERMAPEHKEGDLLHSFYKIVGQRIEKKVMARPVIEDREANAVNDKGVYSYTLPVEEDDLAYIHKLLEIAIERLRSREC